MNSSLNKNVRAASGSPELSVVPEEIAPSSLGSAVRIQGEIHSRQDLWVNSEVSGSILIPAHTLTIGPQANVKAEIKGQSVLVIGTVEGKIEASERIELRSSCQLTGDVRSPRVKIENGAYIKGTIEVTRPAQQSSNPPELVTGAGL